jgi:hypothetical protein
MDARRCEVTKKKPERNYDPYSAKIIVETGLFFGLTFRFSSQAVRNLGRVRVYLPLRLGRLTQMLALYPLLAFEYFFHFLLIDQRLIGPHTLRDKLRVGVKNAVCIPVHEVIKT